MTSGLFQLPDRVSHIEVTPAPSRAVLFGGNVENTSTVLTIKEVATILRCPKAHALNVICGRVPGLPKLTHLTIGRRKVIRRDWLESWIDASKSR